MNKKLSVSALTTTAMIASLLSLNAFAANQAPSIGEAPTAKSVWIGEKLRLKNLNSIESGCKYYPGGTLMVLELREDSGEAVVVYNNSTASSYFGTNEGECVSGNLETIKVTELNNLSTYKVESSPSGASRMIASEFTRI